MGNTCQYCIAYEARIISLENALKLSQAFDKSGHKLLDISIKDGQRMVTKLLELKRAIAKAEGK